MKQFVKFLNHFAILYGSVCGGLAVVSAYKYEPVGFPALGIGIVGTSLASFISLKRGEL